MNNKKDNHNFYQNTFNKVHASDELVRKVKSMTKDNAKRKIYTLRKVLCVAAAAVFLFVASNIVTYAATGETWIEMITVRVNFNGEDKDIDFTKRTYENGNVSYEMTIPVEDKDGKVEDYTIKLADETKEGYEYSGVDGIDAIQTYSPKLVEENGKIYLVDDDMKVKEDITEDFADGKATVTVKSALFEEHNVVYTAEGTIGDYTVKAVDSEADNAETYIDKE